MEDKEVTNLMTDRARAIAAAYETLESSEAPFAVHVLASGSQGNATLITYKNTTIW